MDLIKPQSEFNPEAPETGFYDLPESVYRTAPGINWSNLKWAQQSEKTYKAHCEAQDKDSPDKQTGRIFHCMVLEPDKVSMYITPPETYTLTPKKKDDPPKEGPWNMNAKHCRAWKAAKIELGFEVVKQAQIDEARELADALSPLPYVQEVMADLAGTEVAVFWTDHVTGLLCKAKLDGIRNTFEIIDLKSITPTRMVKNPMDDIGALAFYSQHHIQAAFYRDGVDAVLSTMGLSDPNGFFTFLYVEKGEGHDTAILAMSSDPRHAFVYPWIHNGRELYHALLQTVSNAIDSGFWPSWFPGPGGETDFMLFTIPEFLAKKLEVNTIC